MAKGEDITTKFKVDISDLKKGITDANQQIKLANAQFKAATAGMDDWSHSTDGVGSKIKQLESILKAQVDKLKAYKQELTRIEQAQSENGKRADVLKAKLKELADKGISKTSEEYKKYEKALNDIEKEQSANAKAADSLKVTILNQQAAVNGTAKDLRNYKASLDSIEDGSSDATKHIKDMDKELDKVGEHAEEAADGFTVLKGALAGIISSGVQKVFGMITDSIDGAMTRIDTMNQFSRTITTMTGSSEKAADALQKVTDIVKGTAYGLNVAAKSTQNFVTSGMSLDKATEQVKLWGDAVAFYGDGTNDTYATVTDAIAKMVAQGKVQGDQLDRLTDAGIPAVQLFADATGRSFADVRDSLSNGKISTTQFLDTLEKAMNDGTKSFASIEGAAKDAGSSWTGTIDNMRAAITRGVVAFINGTEKALKKNKMPTMQEMIKRFGKEMETVMTELSKELPKVIKFINETYKTAKKLAPVIKAVGAAYLTWAVSKKVQDLNKQFRVTTTIMSLLEGTTKKATIAQNAHTVATNLGTKASLAFSTAWKSNPIGLIATAIALALPLLEALAKAIKEANKETDKNVIATDKLVKKQKEFTKELKETTKEQKENMKAAQEEGQTADFLFERLQKLEGVQDKTNAQKAEMKRLVDELNKVIPNLNLEYDKEKDALNQSTEAIRDNIEAQKDLVLAKAAQENLSKTAEKIVETENKLSEATSQHEKNEKNYLKAKKEREAFEKKYAPWVVQNSNALTKKRWELIEAEKNAERAYGESEGVVKKYDKTLSELKDTYDATAKQANNFLDQADISKGMAKLVEKCRKAGRELPLAISDGITAGNYAIPESMAELDTLIKFDDALSHSEYAGKQIPTYISQGVLNGKTSIEGAMDQIGDVLTLAKKAQKLVDEGKAVPKNLADGILDGTYSVDEANKILTDKVTYNELKAKAKEAGASIPKNMVQSIQEGTMSLEQASKLLEDSIKFTEVTNKAKNAGIKVPKSLAEGITSGEIQPQVAIDRIQALINYQKMLDDAGLAGQKVPKIIKDGIISGKTSVEAGSQQMNKWISLKTAVETAGIDSSKIPDRVAKSVINGKTSVEDAIKQMNNWVKFEEALSKTNKAGTEIPEKLQKGILSGKVKPKQAMKELNATVKTEADNGVKPVLSSGQQIGTKFADGVNSKKGDAKAAGENLIEGTNQGINNPGKQSSVLSSIWNFGKTLLGRFQKSLDEHSPSKTTNKYGQYLLEGLGIGIEKKEDSLYKQITKVGKSTLKTFKDANDSNNYVSMGEKLGTQFEKGVNSSTKKSISAVTALVNKTVTSMTNSNKKAASQYSKAGTAIINAYTTAVNKGASKAVSAVEKTLNKLGTKAQEQYNQTIADRDAFMNKLSDTNKLFATKSTGELYLGTLKKSADQVVALGKNLTKLKKILPNGLMNDILGMDTDTASTYTKTLLSLSDKDLKAYIKAYKQRETAAKSVSTTAYASELGAIEKNFNTSVTKELSKLQTKLNTVGKDAMAGFVTGMNSKTKSLKDSAKNMASEVVKAFKKELKIKSPSKVFEQISAYIPEGAAKGIDNNVGTIVKSARRMANMAANASQNLLSNMAVPQLQSANGAVPTSSSISNNYVQNIYAPQQPSRAELYRQTKNLLNLTKGGK